MKIPGLLILMMNIQDSSNLYQADFVALFHFPTTQVVACAEYFIGKQHSLSVLISLANTGVRLLRAYFGLLPLQSVKE